MAASPQEDVRDLLGMRSRGAWLILACYFAAMIVVTVASADHVTNPWPPIAATIILIAATITLVTAPGDPLPAAATIALTMSGPVACALVLSVTPPVTQSALQTWIHGGGTAIYCFMNVRGRRITPWIGLAGMIAVFALWAEHTGQGAMSGIALVAIDAAPLAMAALLSFTLRPTAKAVFSLRAQTTARVAELSADTAASDERRRQLRHLDSLVRPLLGRIAHNEELTEAERTECELIEAHLRDRLLAPVMSVLDLDDAAYQARTRGIDVVLVDARGPRPHTLDDTVTNAIHTAASEALRTAPAGRVTVRLLPAGRSAVASVSVSIDDDHGSHLHEIDHTGHIHRRL
ncbi:hypothetical protein [Prescottella agglutinans]|jgi:hypothetical protein|uniref:Uncharacterized protein n=1 Tax=Prescottella agglutinans TaxID=1644129 RepID=A0ABT6MKQ3_9NOCA|nr:hypothetical protein [Prescottella agglutinans]MDH6284906.1 hypothetical protein [Prescottella agglutinans]